MVLNTKLFILVMLGLSFCGFSHCNVFETLKDAVLGAESMAKDIGSSVNTILELFSFTAEAWLDSIEEECIFTCANGNKPQKKKYYKPTSNGCGVPGMKINLSAFPFFNEMTKCCDGHDICYGTCNKNKSVCETEFKKCLYKVCKRNKKEPMLSACKTAAKGLFSGTTVFGCKFYKTAQEEACDCGFGKYRGDEL